MLASGEQLQQRYPELTIHAVVTDFEERLAIPDSAGPRLVVFLGGTIGNLLPRGALGVPGAAAGRTARRASGCCSARTW